MPIVDCMTCLVFENRNMVPLQSTATVQGVIHYLVKGINELDGSEDFGTLCKLEPFSRTSMVFFQNGEYFQVLINADR